MSNRRFKLIHIVAIVFGFASLAVLTAATMPGQTTQYYLSDKAREDSKMCLECHDDMATSLKHSAHTFSTKDDLSKADGIACVGCHDGGATHMEDPSRENITTPAELDPLDQAAVCSRCHVNPHQISMASSDAHARAGLGCLDCHSIHGNTNMKLVKSTEDNFCGTCHQSVMSEFKRRSSHPLEAGELACVSCHDMSGLKDPMFTQGSDWTCQNCHSDKSGPFPFEHPVTGAHLVNGGGCVECHQPHGSPNDRLLSQPNNNTCLQCHTIPALHKVQHSGLGAQMACVQCHTGIHGSFSNDKLLDPELGTKLFPNCYQSGCHDNVIK